MKIIIQQVGTTIPIVKYESVIAPLVGDIYSGMAFEDNQQRTIKERQLLISVLDTIIVYVDYTFPNLLPQTKELNTITEQDLVTEKS